MVAQNEIAKYRLKILRNPQLRKFVEVFMEKIRVAFFDAQAMVSSKVLTNNELDMSDHAKKPVEKAVQKGMKLVSRAIQESAGIIPFGSFIAQTFTTVSEKAAQWQQKMLGKEFIRIETNFDGNFFEFAESVACKLAEMNQIPTYTKLGKPHNVCVSVFLFSFFFFIF